MHGKCLINLYHDAMYSSAEKSKKCGPIFRHHFPIIPPPPTSSRPSIFHVRIRSSDGAGCANNVAISVVRSLWMTMALGSSAPGRGLAVREQQSRAGPQRMIEYELFFY